MHFILYTRIGIIWSYKLIEKILIIDEEIIFCNALRYHLTQKGFNVAVCTSYLDNQNKINICEFDLILVDLNHKDIKGFEFLQIARKTNPETKIIVLSSHLEHIDISNAKQLGAYDCASKNSQLFQALDKIIKKIMS